MPYKCSMCGEVHEDLPHIGSEAPYHWGKGFGIDPQSLLPEDLCIIEGRNYFVRGVIEIPVHDYEHEFGWGVWVSHKKENFEIYRENSQAADIGPFFGWLCTAIDYYDEATLSLKTIGALSWGRAAAVDYCRRMQPSNISPTTGGDFTAGCLGNGASLR